MTNEAVFEQITARDEARQRATLAKDFDAVDEIIGSSLRYVHGSATDEDRDLYLKRLREGHYNYQSLQVVRRDFRQFGDVVLVNGDIKIHVIVAGTEKNFTGRFLQVWALEEGAWRMVGWQTTPVPA